jgi:hypothetical protein
MRSKAEPDEGSMSRFLGLLQLLLERGIDINAATKVI